MAARRKATKRKPRSDKGASRVLKSEKRIVAGYSLPPRYIAALVAVARVRTEKTGMPVSASAVLSGLLAGHIDQLEQEAGG